MGGKRTLRYEPVKAIIDETREQFGNEQRIDRNGAPNCRRLNHQSFTTSQLKANCEPRFYDQIVLIPPHAAAFINLRAPFLQRMHFSARTPLDKLVVTSAPHCKIEFGDPRFQPDYRKSVSKNRATSSFLIANPRSVAKAFGHHFERDRPAV